MSHGIVNNSLTLLTINNPLSNLSTRRLTFSMNMGCCIHVICTSTCTSRSSALCHISMRHLESFMLKPD